MWKSSSAVVDMTIENILGIGVKSRQIKSLFQRFRKKRVCSLSIEIWRSDRAINGQNSSISDLETMLANLKSEHKGSAIFTIQKILE